MRYLKTALIVFFIILYKDYDDWYLQELVVIQLKKAGPLAKDALPKLKTMLYDARLNRGEIEAAIESIVAAKAKIDDLLPA